MTAKDLRKTIMHYLGRNPTADEIELHSVHHRAHIEKWNVPEKQPSTEELERLLDEAKDIDYAEMKERFLPEAERKEQKFNKQYPTEERLRLQDEAIAALAEGRKVPSEYTDYIHQKGELSGTGVRAKD
jgi:hypothetical protein